MLVTLPGQLGNALLQLVELLQGFLDGFGQLLILSAEINVLLLVLPHGLLDSLYGFLLRQKPS